MADPPDPADPLRLETHRALIRRVARGLVRDLDELDEVEAETVAAAVGGRPPEGEGLAAWLAVVARRVARRRREKAAARAARERSVARSEDAVPSPDAIAAAEETRARVLGAVLDLPRGQREAVLARYHLGLSERGAARRLGIGTDALRARLKRARAALRERLLDDFDGDARALVPALLPLAAPPAGLLPPLTAPPLNAAPPTLLPLAMQKPALVVSLVALALVAVGVVGLLRPTASGSAGTQGAVGREVALAPPPGPAAGSATAPPRAPAVGIERDPVPTGVPAAAPGRSGRVVDAEGRPLAGAWVVATRAASPRLDLARLPDVDAEADVVRTDAAGRFEFPPEPDHAPAADAEDHGRSHDGPLDPDPGPDGSGRPDPGRTLVAWAPGAAPLLRWSPAPARGIELQLATGQSFGGRVLDREDRPVAGAELTLRWTYDALSHRERTLSDEDGNYRFDGLPHTWRHDHELTLHAVAPDGETLVERPFGFEGGRRAELGPERELDMVHDVRLRGRRPLEVRVAGPDGEPLVGAEVLAWFDPNQSRSFVFVGPDRYAGSSGIELDRGRTDAEGRWTTNRVPDTDPDTEALRAQPLAFVTVLAPEVGVVHTAVGPVRDDRPLEISVPRAVELSGRVVRADGRPVAGAHVRLNVHSQPITGLVPGLTSDPHEAWTDAEGRFEILGAPEGVTATLVAMLRPEAGATWCRADLRLGAIAPLAEPAELVLDEPDTEVQVHVRVLDPGGGPVPDALVGLDAGGTGRINERARTDAEGRARFEPSRREIESGVVTLAARHPRFGDVRETVRLEGSVGAGAPELPLRFGEGRWIEGRVVDPEGAPVLGARVRTVPATEPSDPFERMRRANRFTTTDGLGRFRIRGEGPSPHRLRVSLDPAIQPRPPLETEVSVDADVEPRIVVERPDGSAGARLTVRIEGDVPVASVRVSLMRGGWSSRTRLVRLDRGLFGAAGLEPGPATVAVDFATARDVELEVELPVGGERELVIAAPSGGSIGGRNLAAVPAQVSLYLAGAEVGYTTVEPGATYAFDGLGPGSYAVDAVATGEGEWETALRGSGVELEPGEVRRDVDLTGEPARKAVIRVGLNGRRFAPDAVGLRIRSGQQSLRWISRQREGATWFDAGSLEVWTEVVPVPSGILVVEVVAGDEVLAEGPLEEREGGSLRIRLDLPPAEAGD